MKKNGRASHSAVLKKIHEGELTLTTKEGRVFKMNPPPD
jgi:hypothetical protein